MLYNWQFIDNEEAPQKKSAHFLLSLSPTQYICGAVTSPHTCGSDITGLGLRPSTAMTVNTLQILTTKFCPTLSVEEKWLQMIDA